MPRNISDQSIKNILTTALREVKNHGKQNRTNQVSPLGFFPLPPGVSTTVEVIATIPNGSMYYATNLAKARGKSGGTWHDVF